ncbi:MAG TPA: BON domain-containing protein [Gemmata sp.]|nr:BON domain-containing protein [Gemmata sp.]
MTPSPTATGQSESSGQPPDQLICAVRDALAQTRNTSLRGVVVGGSGGLVVLQGRVPTFYLKQLALVTVMAVPGVESVRNELEVERPQ